jgi:ribosome-associated translation inhibitor RaiA
VSAYQEARQRRDRAVDAHLAAARNLAEAREREEAAYAELDEAASELRRHEIDPEYRGQQHRKAVAA